MTLFYFNGGVHHGAQHHGSRVCTLKGSELYNDAEDDKGLPEPHSGQRRVLCWRRVNQ